MKKEQKNRGSFSIYSTWLVFLIALFTACNPAENTPAELSPEEAKSIAREAFLWGMHPVAIYHLRYNYAQNDLSPIKVGLNRLAWFRKPMKAIPKVATTPQCHYALRQQ